MAFQVLHSPAEWCQRFGANCPRTVLTVGNFDGLHLGHQRILRGVVARARGVRALAAVITFDPHPVKVLRPAEAPALIATLAQRLAGLEQIGLDAALVVKFDHDFSRITPEEFVRRILAEQLCVQAILVGENFRFGHRHAGDVKLLARLGREIGFDVELVPPVVVHGTIVSSTAVRCAVREGSVDRAARLLGRPFALSGQIRPGTGQGRRLVFPTLNLAPDQELLPKLGVYVTETVVASRRFGSATNVGLRPTFDGRQLSVESHLFDFSDEVTSGAIEVRFWKRLRDEKKFPGPEALRAQIRRDLTRARAFFRRRPPQRAARPPALSRA